MELADAFKDSLDRKGLLGEIRANLRTQVFHCFQSAIASQDELETSRDQLEAQAPATPTDNKLIDELIMEYLEYNGHIHTLSTFVAETSRGKWAKDARNGAADQELRHFLEKALVVEEDQSRLPLICRLIRYIRRPT